MSLLIFLYFLQENRSVRNRLLSVGILLLADAAFLALVYTPLHKMQRSNQFEYWNANGFYRETIISLVDNVLYGSRMIDLPFDYFGIVAVMLTGGLGAFAFYSWGRHGRAIALRTPALLAVALIGVTVWVNIMQTVVLKTPNLSGRTALLFYPLFILCVGAVLHHISNRHSRAATVTGGVLLVLAHYHLIRTFSPDRVREWYFDANTFDVLDLLKNRHPQNGPPAEIAVDWRFHRSFDFYVQTGKAPHISLAPSRPVIDTTLHPRYFYIFNEDFEKLKNQYEPIAQYDNGSRFLMQKKE